MFLFLYKSIYFTSWKTENYVGGNNISTCTEPEENTKEETATLKNGSKLNFRKSFSFNNLQCH